MENVAVYGGGPAKKQEITDFKKTEKITVVYLEETLYH